MKIQDIALWEAFLTVAQQKGFSAAARSLRLTVPQVSKRVAKLEDALGVLLFRRSTRVVTLTDEGRALLPKVNSLLEDLQGLERSFESSASVLSGSVRIASVPFIAHRLLVPVIREFSELHPKVRIELELSETIINLVESNIDIAIRIHDEPSESEHIYRKLAANDLVVCATPAYLKSAPRLNRPADLKKHRLLMMDVHGDCAFRNSSSRLQDFMESKALNCENGDFLIELALAGFGVLVKSIWDVREYLKSGRLTQVLEKYPLTPFGNIYAVIPSRRLLATRVRAFLDLVVMRSQKWVL